MIVVADISPLNYLIQIDCIDLLPKLYDRIIVPQGVFDELSHSGAPRSVSLWVAGLQGWVEVRSLQFKPDPELDFLDRGEREAIQIALEQRANLLLIDELLGRTEAERRGLNVTGTLGVLIAAGRLRLIDPESAYRRLIAETTFRSSAVLESLFLTQIRSAI